MRLSLFVGSFLFGFLLTNNTTLTRATDLSICAQVKVEEGAKPLDCPRFIAAWDRAVSLYQKRVESAKGIDPSFFNWVKVKADGLSSEGLEMFKVGDGIEVYAIFTPEDATIHFIRESSVTHEGVHAIDWFKHPLKKRRKDSENVFGRKDKYRWQILMHETPDDPMVEK